MKSFFATLLWVLALGVQAQPPLTPPDLSGQLQGKVNFQEIKTIVSNYISDYKASHPGNDGQSFAAKLEKHWYRWFLFNADRLDEKGNIINIPKANMAALAEVNANPGLVAQADGNAQWVTIGPNDRTRIGSGHNSGLGRANCIAFHPTDVNQLYVGTPAGGLWKSNNGGSSWFPLTDMLPSLGVSGIVVDWNNANRIYVLTGDGDGGHMGSIGVLVSTNGGSTWLPTGDLPGLTDYTYHGCKLIQHPTAAGTLLAATTAGIFRTTNSGGTWTLEQSGDFTDIEFKPGDPTIMYAARRNSSTPFYRSTNTGDTWTTSGITGVPTTASRIAIGVTPANTGYVYFLAGPVTSTNNFVGVYRSTNSGLAFSTRSSSPNILGYANDGNDDKHQTNYDLAMEVNRTNAEQILTGGINVWYNGSGGSTGNFVRRSQWYDDAAGEYVHADIHDLRINPDNNRLYVCSDGGVAYSDNNGLNWTRIWTSFNTMQFYHMTGYNADANLLVGGTQDNGTNYRKSNTTNYHHIEGADGYSAVIDWSNTNRVFMTENGGLNRTDDGGSSAYGIKPPTADGCWPTIVQHPADADTIYAGYCNSVFKSWNRGAAGSWSDVGFGAPTELVIAPTNGRRLIGANGTDMRRTANGGTTWESVNTKPGFNNGRSITDITFNPSNSNGIAVAVGGTTAGQKVYRSTNFADNWTNVTYNLPNASATAIGWDNAGHLYVGMDVGVFVLPAGTAAWVPFYNFLPKTIINDFIINEGAGLIRAATFGRGVWETELFGSCPATLTLINNQVFNQRYWQAATSITSQQMIMNTTGNDVFYSAGNNVTLQPGFEAFAGSRFRAYISPCNNGIPAMAPLKQDFDVSSKEELIKIDFSMLDSMPASASGISVTLSESTTYNVSVDLAGNDMVVMYAERLADGEILSMVMQSPLLAGKYNFALQLDKLKQKGVVLRWRVGDGPKQSMEIL